MQCAGRRKVVELETIGRRETEDAVRTECIILHRHLSHARNLARRRGRMKRRWGAPDMSYARDSLVSILPVQYGEAVNWITSCCVFSLSSLFLYHVSLILLPLPSSNFQRIFHNAMKHMRKVQSQILLYIHLTPGSRHVTRARRHRKASGECTPICSRSDYDGEVGTQDSRYLKPFVGARFLLRRGAGHTIL